MTQFFPTIHERRYTSVKRRYSNEYFFDSRRRPEHPQVTIKYATLASARDKATRAIDRYQCTTVRVFDHIIGEYIYTYKATVHGMTRHEGMVR